MNISTLDMQECGWHAQECRPTILYAAMPMLLNLSTWNSNSVKQSILAKRVRTSKHSVNVMAIKI